MGLHSDVHGAGQGVTGLVFVWAGAGAGKTAADVEREKLESGREWDLDVSSILAQINTFVDLSTFVQRRDRWKRPSSGRTATHSQPVQRDSLAPGGPTHQRSRRAIALGADSEAERGGC